MSSLKARVSALAVAAVFVMVGATGAFAQGTGAGAAGTGGTGTGGTAAGDPGSAPPAAATGDAGTGTPADAVGTGGAAETTLDQAPAQPGTVPLTEPGTQPMQPGTQQMQPGTQMQAQPGIQTQVQPGTQLQTTEWTAARFTDPQQVSVPPQSRGPLTVGSFNAAVRLQSQNIARLNRLGTNIPGQRITVINVRNLHPGPATAATARAAGAVPTTGVDNAITQAESRSAAAAQAAARNNTAVANALSQANISIDNVLAIAVRGHNLNDVTVYHR
jgi:hypothetical protein